MIDLIKERLRRYAALNPLKEENAVKEMLQEIALYRQRAGLLAPAADAAC